jgi:deoxyribose-phosphate aldolase
MKPKADVKETADALRDLKNWVAEYAREFDLDAKAKKVLEKKIEEVAQKLARIECK